MKKLLVIFILLFVSVIRTTIVFAQANPCANIPVVNCTVSSGDPFAVSVVQSAPCFDLWNMVTISDGSISANPTTNLSGLLDVTTTSEDCEIIDTVIPLDNSSIISSDWTVFINGSSSPAYAGSGLMVNFSDFTSAFTWAAFKTENYNGGQFGGFGTPEYIPEPVGAITLIFAMTYTNSCGLSFVSSTNEFIVTPVYNWLDSGSGNYLYNYDPNFLPGYLSGLVNGIFYRTTEIPTYFHLSSVVTPSASPPVITLQPTDQNVIQGAPAIFGIFAEGTAPMYVYWMHDGTNIPGSYKSYNSGVTNFFGTSDYAPFILANFYGTNVYENNNLFYIQSAQLPNQGGYSVVITNAYGCTTSSIANLHLIETAPQVSVQPMSLTGCIGDPVAFRVFAGGTPPLFYQWQRNGSNIPIATNYRFSIDVSTLADEGLYTVIIANALGTISSSAANLVLSNCPGKAPVIESGFTVYTTCVNEPISMSVRASGVQPLFYQWRLNGSTIGDATNDSLDVMGLLSDAGEYSVTVSNRYGVISTNLSLTVSNCTGATNNFPPQIAVAPVDQNVCAGSAAVFEVQATGSPPLSYRWSFNGASLPNETNANLVIQATASTNVGNYSVTVMNSNGNTTASATLTLSDPSGNVSICGQPTNVTILAGESAQFLIQSCGSCPVTYQWVKTGYGNLIDGYQNVVGGQTSNLTLENVNSNDTGLYYVIVDNGISTAASSIVSLSVTYTDIPPTLSYINPVKCAPVNNQFEILFASVLSASDAKDSDNLPIVFQVNSVTNGELTIDGQPFLPATDTQLGNCKFTSASVLVWTPNKYVPNMGLPAFSVFASDGYKISSNSLYVTCVPQPETYLLGWGDDFAGALGGIYDTSGVTGLPTRIPNLPNLISITGANMRDGTAMAGISTDGNLWVWGLLPDGCSGQGVPESEFLSGSYQFGFLEADKPFKVQMFNEDQTNLNYLSNVTQVVISRRSFEAVSASIFVILSDGTLWSWGMVDALGYTGATIDGLDNYYDLYTKSAHQVKGFIDSLGNPLKVTQITSALDLSLALTEDGTMWWWGGIQEFDYNFYQFFDVSLDVSDPDNFPQTPQKFSGFGTNSTVVQIAEGSDHCMVLKGDGTVWEFGFVERLGLDITNTNTYNNLTNDVSLIPIQVDGFPAGRTVKGIACTENYSLAMLDNGTVYAWGTLGAFSSFNPTQVAGLSNIICIQATDGQLTGFSALDEFGHLWIWGDWYFGQMDATDYQDFGFYNNGNYATVSSPCLVLGVENITIGLATGATAYAYGCPETGRPTDVIATALDESTKITWTKYVGASTYNIYRSFQSGGPYIQLANTTSNNFLDTELNNGGKYYYVITAVVTDIETPYSDEVSCVPYASPSQPTWDSGHGNSVTPGIEAGCRDIRLFWNFVTNATSYSVFRGNSPGGPFLSIAQTTQVTYTDSLIESNLDYFYYIAAVNGAGVGISSQTNGPTELMPTLCAPAPVILELTNISDANVQITWQYSLTNGLEGFDVQWYFYGPQSLNKQAPTPATSFSSDYVPIINNDGSSNPYLDIQNNTYVYSFTNFEQTIPNLQIWFKVNAVVNGEISSDSEIAGPILDCATCNADSPGTVIAVPGDNQVFLEWQQPANATVYDVEYTNSQTITNWTLAVTNTTATRFWHTNLDNGTTYTYQIIPKTLLDYIYNTNNSNLFYIAGPASSIVSATPKSSFAPLAVVNFTAIAQAYDGMVYLQWNSIGIPPVYQCFVERKLQGTSDSLYATVSATGFSTSFLDKSVINGISYTYRVTAFDTNYNRFQSVVNAAPTATGVLTVVATPGNGYVNLNWNSLNADFYVVQHSLQSGGPYDLLASGLSQPTYIDSSAQNGVSNYYVVQAQTIFNTTLVSQEVSAKPSALDPSMPPNNFSACICGGLIVLAWNPVAGSIKYEVSQSLPPDNLIYSGNLTSYAFTVPTSTVDGAIFTFDLVAVNPIGARSSTATVIVSYTNSSSVTSPDASQIELSVGNHLVLSNGDSITINGPTNLILSASLKATNANGGEIYFYNNGNVIGSAPGPLAQMTWFNVPGGYNQVSAQAVSTPNGEQVFFGASVMSFTSPSCLLNVSVVPPLETYQTSATDLQLPAPGLPIVISRSYNSQQTNCIGGLGTGWAAVWNTAALQIANANLYSGWIEAGGDGLTVFYAAETRPHLITITLPGGNCVYFSPILTANQGEPSDGGPIALSFVSCVPNQGSLICSMQSQQITEVFESDEAGDWNNRSFSLVNDPDASSSEQDGLIAPDTFVYINPSGTQYRYEQMGAAWLLTSITDANGNSLVYNYTPGGLISQITHSNGRQVQFSYTTNSTGVWINVFDMISENMPAVQYFIQGSLTNGLLTEVDKLNDRMNGIYDQTTFVYGTANDQNLNLLTQVFDGRGLMVVSNQYSASNNGTLANQFDALLHNSTYTLSSGVEQVSRVVSGSNLTSTVNYAPSGAIAQVLQPISDPGYSGNSYAYDNQGNLISQTDSYGNNQTTSYDSLNRPIGQSDALGNSTSAQLDAAGHPLVSTDAGGNSTTNVYDANENLTSSQDPTGTLGQTTYTTLSNNIDGGVAAGGLVQASSQQAPGVPFNTVTEYTYYQNNAVVPVGNLTGEVQSMAQQWTSGDGTPFAPILPAIFYQYDANGNKTQQNQSATVNGTPGTAITTQYQYDGENRLIATVDPLGRTSSTLYDGAGRGVITTDVDGRATTNTYDAIGNLIETAYADGTVTRLTYDELNHVLYTQDRTLPSGTKTFNAATLNVYDGAGRVVCVERLSEVILIKIINNNVVLRSGGTNYPYQNVVYRGQTGNLVSFTRSVYDLDGRIQYAMAANGTVTEYDYDADGRRTNLLVYTEYTADLTSMTSVIAPSGDYTQTQSRYDALGNQVAMVDGNGHETDYSYDGASRLILTTYPLVAGAPYRTQTGVVYDGMGNKIRSVDEAGVATACTYDFRGLLTSVTLDAGSAGQLVYGYGYDEMGNLIKETDANGNVTQYQYDQLGRRTQRQLADGAIETTQYADVPVNNGANVNVQQTSVTDFRGATIVTTEDVMNRPASKVLPAINPGERPQTVAYAYTAGGQLNQVQSTSNGVAVRTEYYYYDGLNRLTNKDLPEGVLAYTWTPDNHVQTILGYRRSAVTTPGVISGSAVPDVAMSYGYDYVGRLSLVENNYLTSPDSLFYGYDGVGNLSGADNSTLNWSYNYTAQNRLSEMDFEFGDSACSYVYVLDPTGARTGVAETCSTNLSGDIAQHIHTASYSYDQSNGAESARVHRLTKESFSDTAKVLDRVMISVGGTNIGNITNVYDPVGNRVSRKVGFNFSPSDSINNQAFSFDHRDQIDSDNIPNNFNPNYDANGNTLADNGTNTGDLYDAENRLTSRGNTIHLTYDDHGNRVSKTVNGTITYYLVDDQNPSGYAQVLAEYSATSAVPTLTYAYGLDLISQQQSSGRVSYYGKDGQGSVRELISLGDDAQITDTYEYDAYGNLIASTGTTINNYRYTGQQWDADLKLAYHRARYCSYSLGRFWNKDTDEGQQGDPLSLHKYLYCDANPVNGIDPSGHDLGEAMLSMSIQVSMAAQTYAPIVTAGRIAVAGVFAANMIFNDQFRQDALALGPNLLSETIAESGMVLYDLSGMAISTIRMTGTVVPEAANLGETLLKNVPDDALVHFVPLTAVKKVEVEGLKYVEGGVGLNFFKASEMKKLTLQKVQNAIGDLAGSSQNIGGVAIVNPSKLSDLQEFQMSFWKEYVTRQQSVMPDEIRYLSGGN